MRAVAAGGPAIDPCPAPGFALSSVLTVAARFGPGWSYRSYAGIRTVYSPVPGHLLSLDHVIAYSAREFDWNDPGQIAD